MSCPRGTTRAAFARLAADAIARADPDGDQAASICRALIDLLAEERPGAARWASPGGLTHLAELTAVAAAAGGVFRSALATGGAVPRLLSCLTARYAHETGWQSRPAATAGAAPAQPPLRLLQDVGGFGAVVSSIGRILAPAGGQSGDLIVKEALREEGASASVTDRHFLSAALRACPHEAGDLLVNLVWRGREGVQGGCGEASGGIGSSRADGDNSAASPAIPLEDSGMHEEGSEGNGDAMPRDFSMVGLGTAEPTHSGGQEIDVGVGEMALNTLLEIVLDARRNSQKVGAAATVAVAGDASGGPAAVDLGVSMAVLSRVLHLRGVGAERRLEMALGRLDAAAKSSDRAGGGCGGGVYLAGRLVTSLFVHVPEARAVLLSGTPSPLLG